MTLLRALIKWGRGFLFYQGYDFSRISKFRPLQVEDLKALSLSATNTQFDIDELKFKNSKNSRWSFLALLLKKEKRATLKTIFLFQWFEIMSIVSALALNHFLISIGTDSVGSKNMFIVSFWGVLFSVSSVVSTLVLSHYILIFMQAKFSMSYGLREAILKKSFLLNFKSRKSCPSGDLMNRLEVDVDAVTNLVERIADFLGVVTHLVLSTFILYQFLGIAGAISVVSLSGIIPLAKHISKKSRIYELEVMNRRDHRVTYMSQIISGIRIIKSFVWERVSAKEISKLRQAELESLEKKTLLNAFGSLVFLGAATFAAVLGFGIYAALGIELTAAKVFAALIIYAELPMTFVVLKDVITVYAKTMASSERLVDFFALPEREPINKDYYQAARDLPFCESNEFEVDVISASVKPPLKINRASVTIDEQNILKDISFELKDRESVAIVGRVGSGKSILLERILGEIEGDGTITLDSDPMLKDKKYLDTKDIKIAYVPQQSFIMNSTVRSNVEFGSKSVSEEKILQAAELCSFTYDLQQMPRGLDTEIGEHGINLSGGQKQRLSLVRAVVREPDVILLDDPFSALDTKTEKEIVDRLLFDHWNHKKIICVTHRLSSLSRFSRILFLEQGSIKGWGTYDDLMQNNSDFRTFMESELIADEVNGQEQYSNSNQSSTSSAPNYQVKPQESSSQEAVILRENFIQKEDRRMGRVRKQVYSHFLRALTDRENWKTSIFTIILIPIGAKTLSLIQNFWLKNWTQYSQSGTGALSSMELWSFYAFIALMALLFAYFGQRVVSLSIIRAANRIHNQALNALIRAPLRYFDVNPSGRILNRFSIDLEKMESTLSQHIIRYLESALNMLFKIGYICWTMPMMVLAILPLGFAYYRFFLFTQPTSRDMARLISLSRSPLFAYFRECIKGRSSIIAYDRVAEFTKNFMKKVERSQRVSINAIYLRCFTDIHLGLLSTLYIGATTFCVLYLLVMQKINSSMAGLILVFTNEICSNLKHNLRGTSEIENAMV